MSIGVVELFSVFHSGLIITAMLIVKWVIVCIIIRTEFYIMACIHTYICDFELASKYLDKFTAFINE